MWRATLQGSRSSQAGHPTPSRPRFPSSTPPPSSAHLHFKSGAVQEVFARSQEQSGKDASFEPVWEAGELVRVDVPLGGRLWWRRINGGEGSFDFSDGRECTADACEGIGWVRLEQDVRIALEQMREADLSSDLVVSLPARLAPPSDSVTLVTQFTLSRIARFERMADAWEGPLSATVYLTDPSDIALLVAHLDPTTSSPFWDKVALTLVKPDYSLQEEALLKRLRYPINRLRNLAIEAAPSPYLLVVDVDFVPSPSMASILSTRGLPLLIRPSSRNSNSPTLRRTALVIPTFELVPAFNSTFPATIDELEALYFHTPPLATLTDINAGHGPSKPNLLFASPPASPASSGPGAGDPSSSYPVPFEPQWEPYYLLARSSHPLYDERFTDQGGDKQSHAMLLNALGYEFRVLRDVWVIHPPKRDRREEQWPAARLVRQGGKPDGSEADLKHLDEASGGSATLDDHFNLEAQKDETRFRYFQDYLSELQRDRGRSFRWPRGSGAREVGERTFGRARLRSTFGP